MFDETDFAEVFHSANPMELGMVQSLLEEAGVPSALSGGAASSFLTAHMGSGGVQAVVVPRAAEEKALALLEQALGDETEGSEDDAAAESTP